MNIGFSSKGRVNLPGVFHVMPYWFLSRPGGPPCDCGPLQEGAVTVHSQASGGGGGGGGVLVAGLHVTIIMEGDFGNMVSFIFLLIGQMWLQSECIW